VPRLAEAIIHTNPTEDAPTPHHQSLAHHFPETDGQTDGQ